MDSENPFDKTKIYLEIKEHTAFLYFKRGISLEYQIIAITLTGTQYK